jgi:acyl-CoA hydrolase
VTTAEALARHLPPRGRVALGDGAGAPLGLAGVLGDAAAAVGGVDLLLGWCLRTPLELPHPALRDVRAIMGGYGIRAQIRDGTVGYVPARYGDVAALLHGPLRPDVLLASLVPTDRGLSFATEVGWQRAAIDAGALVLAEVNHALPRTAATPPIPPDRVVVIAETDRPPIALPAARPDATTAEIGRRAAELVPEGATLGMSPGAVGEAVLAALDRPVSLHTGALGDGVIALDRRGLLIGEPRASYVVGGEDLFGWADGRWITAGIDATHDPRALAAHDALVTVHTAFELDEVGNVNTQGFGDDVIAGVGGLQDFAAAAARSARGLSVIALPGERGGRSTLVSRLSAPATIPRTLVDVVVCERGVADLRGLPDARRSHVLRELWGATAPEPTRGALTTA